MKILFISHWLHPKNLNALSNYKNIQLTVINNVNEFNNYNLNDFDCVYSPSEPIKVNKYPNTKFLFGPHFSIYPDVNKLNLINSNNSVYIQPSPWVIKFWESFKETPPNLNINPLPFGVDTNKFYNNFNIKENIFIYYKRRHPDELNFIINFLQNNNINHKIFSYTSGYSEQEYIDYLKTCKFGIWLDASESQGFALEEALSLNIPLLVWNVKLLSQEYGSDYPEVFATSIPYWDERCGEVFYNSYEFEESYNKFINNLNNYKPREYIIENLSMEVCENKLINLINSINI